MGFIRWLDLLYFQAFDREGRRYYVKIVVVVQRFVWRQTPIFPLCVAALKIRRGGQTPFLGAV